jgi:uncharacterized membrane protein
LTYSLPPYFSGGTRVPATFALHYPLLVAHVMFASVAMVTAVAQIWPGLRARRPSLHRRVGRAYVYAAIPAAVCAMVIGAATPFGPFLAVGDVVLASLWLWFTINGYLAARQRQFAQHRRHMVRSATLALSIITNRIWTPVLVITFQPLQDSIFGGNEEHVVWFRGRRGRVVGLDDSTVHGAVVAEPENRNIAVVNFSADRYTAGVVSVRSSTTRRSDTGTRLP